MVCHYDNDRKMHLYVLTLSFHPVVQEHVQDTFCLFVLKSSLLPVNMSVPVTGIQ